MGLVSQVFDEAAMHYLTGHLGIGHNRYSTAGSSTPKNAQPIMIPTKHGPVAVAHNGNLVNYRQLRRTLMDWDIQVDPEEQSDSALIAQTIAHFYRSSSDLEAAVTRAFPYLQGAFSLVVMDATTLVGVRDRNGFRPLALGRIGKEATVVASETCALGTVGAELIREVAPGEMVAITPGGFTATQLAPADPKLCVFEYVYTSRPDSYLNGQSIYQVRKRFGLQSAIEFFPEADVVIPVPDTATPVAIGYSAATGIRFEEGLVKSRYIHRTFIEPDPQARLDKVRMKLTPLPSVIAGQRVILIDDSIVRGTTSRQIIKLVRAAGAREVHMLVSSPPIRYPDFYGIDIPSDCELVAAHRTLDEIRDWLGADSLHYLSLEGMVKAINLPKERLCTACFTGEYPVWPEQLGERPKPKLLAKQPVLAFKAH
jgi:amidophosphoribosyltransferase